MREHKQAISGFSLIQMSIILAMAAVVMVAMLPGYQNPNNANAISGNKMNGILNALRAYEVTHGNLPCPADPTMATGNGYYGIAAANSGTTNDCTGSTPAAAYADATNNIAIGMVPVRSLGLSYDYALDGFGRDISYVVDTNATGCWATASLPGAVTVTDNGINQSTVAALVSHGADGYGAWLPMQGTGGSGTATRFNSGSTDASEAANAEVTAGTLTALTAGNFLPLVNKAPTSTFDDIVVYKNRSYNLNTLPVSNGNATLSSVPTGATYSGGQTLNFTVTFPNSVTISTTGGTPYLSLSALSCSGSTSIGGSGSYGNGLSGCNAIGYAKYSGSSPYTGTSLSFTYDVQTTDNAPSGISVASGITLNGGTISGDNSTCFFGESLPNVILANSSGVWVADFYNNRIMNLSSTGTVNATIGTYGSSTLTDYQLRNPDAIAVDGSGNVWVADSGTSPRIVEFNSSGTWLMTIGGFASGTDGDSCAGTTNGSTACYNMTVSGGTGSSACCAPPSTTCVCHGGGSATTSQLNLGYSDQIAFDTASPPNVWITDYYNSAVKEYNSTTGVYKNNFTISGKSPSGLAIDSGGNFWVIVPGQKTCTLYKCPFSSTGNPPGACAAVSGNAGCSTTLTENSGAHTTTFYGSSSTSSTGASDSDYISIDSGGNVWVVDQESNAIHEFNSSGQWIGDANLSAASTSPDGVYVDSGGNLWITSNTNNKVYKLNPTSGVVAFSANSLGGHAMSTPNISFGNYR